MAGSKSTQPPEALTYLAKDARFVSSADRVSQLPAPECFEVAILGRSNVGKSTFINRICAKKKLARTSSTPGSTHQLVVFEADVVFGEAEPTSVRLVDLPGYGYALRSKSERRRLSDLVREYLECRIGIGAVCLLIDIRRDPESEELECLRFCFDRGLPSMVAVTKSDKLSAAQARERCRVIAKALGLDVPDLVVTGEGHPPSLFWRRVKLLRDAAA